MKILKVKIMRNQRLLPFLPNSYPIDRNMKKDKPQNKRKRIFKKWKKLELYREHAHWAITLDSLIMPTNVSLPRY